MGRVQEKSRVRASPQRGLFSALGGLCQPAAAAVPLKLLRPVLGADELPVWGLVMRTND